MIYPRLIGRNTREGRALYRRRQGRRCRPLFVARNRKALNGFFPAPAEGQDAVRRPVVPFQIRAIRHPRQRIARLNVAIDEDVVVGRFRRERRALHGRHAAVQHVDHLASAVSGIHASRSSVRMSTAMFLTAAIFLRLETSSAALMERRRAPEAMGIFVAVLSRRRQRTDENREDRKRSMSEGHRVARFDSL